jgi:biotin operon repressor
MEGQQITLPAAPKIEQKDTADDKRTFAVVPLAALKDDRLTPGTKAVLAMVCAYCNRAGVTHVSQKRISQDMHTSQSSINRSMQALKKYGYIEQIGKAYPMSRGATIRVVFNPDVTLDDALAIASREGEDLRPAAMRIDDDEIVRGLMEKETWTEQELRENKERLARLLLDAFKTPYDKPHMYMPVEGDTIAVKRMKQEIRSRMRQMRKDEYQQSNQQTNELPKRDTNINNMCLYTNPISGNMSERDNAQTEIEPAKQLGFDELVVYFENELFNGVKTESDLDMCMQLASHGVTREQLAPYLVAYCGDTVTALGRRVLGTESK